MFALLLSFVVLSAALPAKFVYDVPAGWITKAPTSSLRVAEFVLPKVAGDTEDAALVVYYFTGGGGSVQANIDRWIGQMTQPDGRPSSAVATTTKFGGRGFEITLVDVPGTYVAEVSPGSPERLNKPGFRLRAAVALATPASAPAGPYFVKLTGPAKTVTRWDESVTAFLKSMRIE